ncbi:MAG: hypothetical protein IJV08_10285 [Bacteroidaceae bacterium]|nr:hypothetical protein [Bacteroidaceae bacterium]
MSRWCFYFCREIKYIPLYANGKEPVIEEQDVYRIEIPYVPSLQSTEGGSGKKSGPESGPEKYIENYAENTGTDKIESICLTRKLAEVCGVTADGIKYNIRKLRENGITKRITPDKGGRNKMKELRISLLKH